MLTKIVSGGQTGADQAALDAAIALGLDHGGWVPAGRLTERGPLDSRYDMKEMPSAEYAARTEKNVIDSDGTLILSHGALTGGSDFTRKMAVQHGRPWLHLDLSGTSAFQAARAAGEWLAEHRVSVLNVAGSRASKDPRIYSAVRDLLETLYYMDLMNDSGVLDPSELIRRGAEAPSGSPPETLDQAVAELSQRLTLRDRHRIANLDAEGLPELSLSLEPFLRRDFGLSGTNRALIRSIAAAGRAAGSESEEPSFVVARALWERLRATHRLRLVK